MLIYVIEFNDVDDKFTIVEKEFGDIMNLEQFERELTEAYDENWFNTMSDAVSELEYLKEPSNF